MTTIFFATNREMLPEGDPAVFGSNFSYDGLANLRFGRAEVTGDRFQDIAITVAPEDLFADPPVLGSQEIFRQVQQEMKQNAEDTLMLIHGFNTSFREALQMAAQIHANLTRPNPLLGEPLKLNMCLFSWPSDGSLILTDPSARDAIAYKNDRLDAAASGAAFARGFLKVADFINTLRAEEQCEQRLHLMTHSMGTYVLRYAVQQLRSFVDNRIPRIFDQILLIASDEDDDTFDHDYKLHLLPRLTRYVSVYFNRNDLALWASDRLKGNPARLGTDGPLQPLQIPRNVYPIDCTQVIPTRSGPNEQHSYHLAVERVILDIQQVLLDRLPDEIPGRHYVPNNNRYRLT
ncbi:MAG: alpha/beta hydrolase [Synechococcales cyanobacterium T60_A2020_003]|nr:alpha/beta hydrolase [Synechococcales cyanobacterium T60_A2020_003]